MMNPIYKPTQTAEDWREFLADPDKQWKSGYSAKSAAFSWEEAEGIPKEVSSVIESQFGAQAEPLVIIPEYKVPLKGGRRESQNDVFLLARIGQNIAAIMVEAKVNESFGPLIGEWFENPSQGKQDRLKHLCEELSAPFPPPVNLRYQLFHRTVSAILTAKRFNADMAIMLVQSFSQTHKWLEDFKAFASYLNTNSSDREKLHKIPLQTDIPTYLGWVTGDPKYLNK